MNHALPGMAVGADDAVAGSHQALRGQQGVLDAHAAHVVEVLDAHFTGEFPRLFDLLGRLDVLIRGEVIHHQGHPAFVVHPAGAAAFELVDGHRGGDVVAQAEIELRLDELPGPHLRQARVGGQNFLCHCHTHGFNTSCMVRQISPV